VNALKTQGILKANAPCLGCLDEAKVPYEEDAVLKDRFRLALQLARQRAGDRIPEVDSQGSGADNRPNMKLNLARLTRRANSALPLQIGDEIDERGIGPRLSGASGLCRGDDVGSGLLHYAQAVVLQLTNDCRLTRTGRSGDDESSHSVFLFLIAASDVFSASSGSCRTRQISSAPPIPAADIRSIL
jgi:hypothetical protein